jgi:hypothetical protein
VIVDAALRTSNAPLHLFFLSPVFRALLTLLAPLLRLPGP